MFAERHNRSLWTQDLDCVLAYKPWLSKTNLKAYVDAVINREPHPPIGMTHQEFVDAEDDFWEVLLVALLSDLMKPWQETDPQFKFWTNGEGVTWRRPSMELDANIPDEAWRSIPEIAEAEQS